MFRKVKIGWTIWNIVEGLILITAGVLFCAYSNNSSFQSTCVLIVAILVIIDAVLRLALNVISVFGLGDLKLIKTDFAAAISGTSELTLGIGLVFLQQDLSKGDILFEAIGITSAVSPSKSAPESCSATFVLIPTASEAPAITRFAS